MTALLVKNITASYRGSQITVIMLVLFLFAAVYNWCGDTRYGLPLEIGETVQILEECAGTKSDTILSLSRAIDVLARRSHARGS